jgi:mannose-6-phosphate isomerase-like protein (cupin superfamily)
MARVFKPSESARLSLPGRVALDLVSGRKGSDAVSLRLVEIPVPQMGEPPRGPHVHEHFEECMYVMSGEGITYTDTGSYPLKPGETILVPAGEAHVTRNTGSEPLMLLCFFPASDIAVGTHDVPALKTPAET